MWRMIEPIEDWAERHLSGWREPYDPQTFNGRLRRLRCDRPRALWDRTEKGMGMIKVRGRSFIKFALVASALVGFVAGATRTAKAGNASYVDPFIGTAAGAQSYAKGNVFPGAVVPHGMVAISPDTNPRYAGGYRRARPTSKASARTTCPGSAAPATWATSCFSRPSVRSPRRRRPTALRTTRGRRRGLLQGLPLHTGRDRGGVRHDACLVQQVHVPRALRRRQHHRRRQPRSDRQPRGLGQHRLEHGGGGLQ